MTSIKEIYNTQWSQINEMEKGTTQKYQFVNVLFASITSSLMIALVMTPFDMVFFKMMAKTANMTSRDTQQLRASETKKTAILQ